MTTIMKNFYTKAAQTASNIMSKTKKAGIKVIDRLTPKHDYSDLTEKEADIMRKWDRRETIDNVFWLSFYFICYLVIIAYCIKQAKDAEIVEDIE